MSGMDNTEVVRFIAEAGMLKRVKRSGWWVLGAKDGESVADHSFRCAVIGYILARMEGVPPYKVLLMSLFNDMHESRLTDLHKMAQRYFPGAREAETRAFREQTATLPPDMREELSALRGDYDRQETSESLVARDADILECLVQAREYQEQGYSEAVRFMKKAPTFLRTRSAIELWEVVKSSSLNDWWEQLSEFER